MTHLPDNSWFKKYLPGICHRLSYNRKCCIHNSYLYTKVFPNNTKSRHWAGGVTAHSQQTLKHLTIKYREGNAWYQWPWSGIGHTRTVLVVILAQCECQHGASVKPICFWPWEANWSEPMEWDLIWCQTEYLDEAACMDMLCVFVYVCMFWIL